MRLGCMSNKATAKDTMKVRCMMSLHESTSPGCTCAWVGCMSMGCASVRTMHRLMRAPRVKVVPCRQLTSASTACLHARAGHVTGVPVARTCMHAAT